MGLNWFSYLLSHNAVAFPRFIRESMCLHPCAPYSETFFSPRSEEGNETMYLCIFDVRTEAWRSLHNAGDST